MIRLLRYVLIVPLALTGTLTLIAAQSMVILGALFVKFKDPADKPGNKRADSKREAGAKSAAADFEQTERNVAPELAYLPLRAVDPGSLILMPGEECFLHEPARLIVQAREQFHVGGFAGFSFGGSKRGANGDDRTRKAKTKVADGRVYVTSTRIVFIGSINVNMHTAQILTLDRTATGVSLSFVHEQPMEFITGNPRLGVTLHHVIYRTTESPGHFGR